MTNAFLNQAQSHDSHTQNMAVSHSTSGNSVLDYFYKMSTYRGRDEGAVQADVSRAFADNPLDTLKAIFYNRMITRKSKGFLSTEKVQKGQGNKDESIKALAWLEVSQPEIFRKNLWLIPVVGCWKDLWYDSASSKYFHYFDPKAVYSLIEKALGDHYNRSLLAKYLPKYRSASNTKNDRHKRINKWILDLTKSLGWSLADYRKFKSNPENTAHLWQRQMSGKLWDSIDFNRIPGKALFNLVSQKGRDKKTALERHSIEDRYVEWIKAQPVVPFTGYPYELYKQAKNATAVVQRLTYNKQFDGMIQKAKQDQGGITGNVWCALDTSGSMSLQITNGLSALDVCVSLGIYFSALNEGAFKDHVIAFDNTSSIVELKGSFMDKCTQARNLNSWGSTNFQSVIDCIVNIRKKSPQIPIEDYPTTLLVVSDMQFNPSGGYYGASIDAEYMRKTETNYETAMRKLEEVGLPKIQIIWWQVNGSYAKDVPNKKDDVGVSLMSGFDGAIISTILGGEAEKKLGKSSAELTPEETMQLALDQEVLHQLQL